MLMLLFQGLDFEKHCPRPILQQFLLICVCVCVFIFFLNFFFFFFLHFLFPWPGLPSSRYHCLSGWFTFYIVGEVPSDRPILNGTTQRHICVLCTCSPSSLLSLQSTYLIHYNLLIYIILFVWLLPLGCKVSSKREFGFFGSLLYP